MFKVQSPFEDIIKISKKFVWLLERVKKEFFSDVHIYKSQKFTLLDLLFYASKHLI